MGRRICKVPAPINVDEALKDTEEFWKEWSSRCTYKGEHRDLVMRSLITLKALIYAPSGGIVAAPTTSLPEKLGGSRNWDYRFCWLRDATFTLLVLMNSGYTDEARAWYRWLLRAVAGAPAEMQIMYGIMGQRRLLEWEADWLPGYGGALPVRVGNAAHAQLQLDVYGELIDAFHQTRVAKLDLEDGTWAVECEILEHLASVWNKPDHGIWERRGSGKHYVLSKVGCWVAFDRAIKSAETFNPQGPRRHSGRNCARRFTATSARKGSIPAKTPSWNPMARTCSTAPFCCCRLWVFFRPTILA